MRAASLAPTARVCRARPRAVVRTRPSTVRASATASSSESATGTNTAYVDVSIGGAPAGRLRFALRPDLAPRTCANFLALVAGTNAGVDPALTYAGCAFEPFSGKYAHVCKGRGKHIYGAGKFVERDAMSATRRSTPGAGGGVYYGVDVDLDDDPNAIVLAVPVAGPGFGATRFAVVRVGDSPGSLRQRLLTNMMVIGTCVEGAETLAAMTVADQPCVIAECGVEER